MKLHPLLHKSLYLITDRHQIPSGKSLLQTIEKALIGGARLIQLREKDLSAAELWLIAQQLRNLTHRFSAKLLINDRIDLALACNADGVHLGEHSLPTTEARRLIGTGRLLGRSTHSVAEIQRAATQGADFVTFGPIYHTPSKAAFGSPMGLEQLNIACHTTNLPVFALGGIKTDHVSEVLSHGASGVALISAIIADSDPQKSTENFLSRLV